MKHPVEQTWQWLAEGWRSFREKAAHALTYFSASGDRAQHIDPIRWGVLAADIDDHGDRVEVVLEVPGLDKADLNVEVLDDQLRISGEKRLEKEDRTGNSVVLERAFGRFERLLTLPARVDVQGAKATYEKGVLRVSLPKTSQSSHVVEVTQV